MSKSKKKSVNKGEPRNVKAIRTVRTKVRDLDELLKEEGVDDEYDEDDWVDEDEDYTDRLLNYDDYSDDDDED